MSAYRPIDCDLHDYLEIACMHRYCLQVELIDGTDFSATALTTRTTSSKEEFLVLLNEGGQHQVRLDRLLAITPLSPGALFGRIGFQQITGLSTDEQ